VGKKSQAAGPHPKVCNKGEIGKTEVIQKKQTIARFERIKKRNTRPDRHAHQGKNTKGRGAVHGTLNILKKKTTMGGRSPRVKNSVVAPGSKRKNGKRERLKKRAINGGGSGSTRLRVRAFLRLGRKKTRPSGEARLTGEKKRRQKGEDSIEDCVCIRSSSPRLAFSFEPGIGGPKTE